MVMESKKLSKYFFISICLLLTSCSGTRLLPKGEKLYTGFKIKLETHEEISNRGYIKSNAQKAVVLKPNKRILGMRPKLWMYLKAGDEPKSKFRKWLKKNGEAPVLMSNVSPVLTSEIIHARLFNIGIFKNNVGFKIIEKKRTASIIYACNIHKPYKIKDLKYDIREELIKNLILIEKEKSLVKSGDDYNLDNLRNERIKIDALLKKSGYFYFNPDYLIFKADTSDDNKSLSLKLTLKDSVPENAFRLYRINNVFIDQEYSLEIDTVVKRDTLKYRNTFFIGKKDEMKIRPKVILRSVYLNKMDIYSREFHNYTLNRLMSMGNFKYVSMKLTESDTSAKGFLDVNILMTPMPKRNLRAEFELVSKSNNYIGPRMNISLMNRNTFRGAELLNLNMAGSIEAQFIGDGKNLFSYSWNPQLELTFPRFVVPFGMQRTSSKNIPKTSFSLSYNYTKRVDYFDMHTLQFIYGFKWRKGNLREHDLSPVNISFTSIFNKSDAFAELLESNPFLKKSYEEQFIAGANYSFTYNEQVLQGKKMQFYFNMAAEVAGNLFSFANIIGGEKISSDNPSEILGSVYSQYARLGLDARAYYNMGTKNKLLMRAFAGIASPYGNSSVLPYSKQFFSGGPNSIRAFHINSLGPGNFNQSADNQNFFQLGGDVKLEMNAEYRFTIYRFFKGALFADAGNVWLLESNPTNIGNPFTFSGFANEIAMGAGIGFRIDVSFFILRFDFATPFRKPWIIDNNKWVIDKINIGSPAWRSENLVLNVAIGYPF